jgi:hypothetical protein
MACRAAVPSLTTVTFARGTTAPLGSTTTPEKRRTSPAKRFVENNTSTATNHRKHLHSVRRNLYSKAISASSSLDVHALEEPLTCIQSLSYSMLNLKIIFNIEQIGGI